ncbi:hypothetical protein JVU11DRAFT_6654 [Chiua virens]|nr:hypothetical protein JVU11DRAFT_6654 [Chiua virens]
MDNDDAPLSTTRRPSIPHDRPSRTPFGPRIRTKRKHSTEMSSGPTSPTQPPLSSRPDSPGASLALIPLETTRSHVAVQVPSTPPPMSATPAPQKPVSSTFIAPPPLTPPPALSFDSTPIPWKGLPFEVAQWTFSSPELQEIVSQAIRLSARESFVRLLSLQALEVDIPKESERLDAERAAAQAKWRFEVCRRNMLLQALNSTVASVPMTNGSGNAVGENEAGSLVAGFIAQLATSIASCDALLSSILQFADQQAQIASLQHQHSASALGVALRKINKAYERQDQELKDAQARVQTLEDELDEAWREAEKMAIEFDDLEQEVVASEVDEAEEDRGPDQEEFTGLGPYLHPKLDVDETGTLGDVTINTDIGVVLGVTATAVASKATLVTSQGSPPKAIDKSDTKSVRSFKSTRSRRSTRDGPSHASRVSAARTRSRTASNASLRLPKAVRAAASAYSPIDAPPIPALPHPDVPDLSFLDMESIITQDRPRTPNPPQYSGPQSTLGLLTPPHSAGLPPTRVPSIWLETDGGNSTRLNGLDRTHSLQIFSSLMTRTPRRTRRSNLVMSLKGADRGSDAGSPIDGSGSGTSSLGAGPASPTSTIDNDNDHSPISLPTDAAHFRGESVTSSTGSGSVVIGNGGTRPGSAGACLTTTTETRTPLPVGTPRRSLVSRASSVILRRLSQATTGSGRSTGSKQPSSPSKSREAVRMSGRWRDGEVMLIGSPHIEVSEVP